MFKIITHDGACVSISQSDTRSNPVKVRLDPSGYNYYINKNDVIEGALTPTFDEFNEGVYGIKLNTRDVKIIRVNLDNTANGFSASFSPTNIPHDILMSSPEPVDSVWGYNDTRFWFNQKPEDFAKNTSGWNLQFINIANIHHVLDSLLTTPIFSSNDKFFKPESDIHKIISKVFGMQKPSKMTGRINIVVLPEGLNSKHKKTFYSWDVDSLKYGPKPEDDRIYALNEFGFYIYAQSLDMVLDSFTDEVKVSKLSTEAVGKLINANLNSNDSFLTFRKNADIELDKAISDLAEHSLLAVGNTLVLKTDFNLDKFLNDELITKHIDVKHIEALTNYVLDAY